jgi:hypothetical protein
MVSRIDLPQEFTAATARREYGSIAIHCDNHPHRGLSRFEHLGDRRVLGTEADTTLDIDADTGEDGPRRGDEGGGHFARRTVVARDEWMGERRSGGDQIMLIHCRGGLDVSY